jgi:hypothetical protein
MWNIEVMKNIIHANVHLASCQSICLIFYHVGNYFHLLFEHIQPTANLCIVILISAAPGSSAPAK